MSNDREGAYVLPPMDIVHHGAGSVSALESVLADLNCENALLITGTTLATKTELCDRVVAASNGRIKQVFHDTKAHVPRSKVLAAARMARDMGADAVVSFGGGSPNDTAKGVVIALSEGIMALDDFDRMRVIYEYPDKLEIPRLQGVPLPLIAIPTTLSAGEFTWFAGITDEDRQVKDLYIDRQITARAVILDSALTLQTPLWLWLSTGMRSVDHCIEAIYSNQSHPYVDATCSYALKILDQGLRDSKADPANVAIRTELQIAAWLSICGLGNVSLGISHGIGHQLGARCGVPHGQTSCVMLHNVLDFNLSHTKDQQSQILNVMTQNGRSPKSAAEAVLQLVKDLNQPWRLRDVDVEEADFAGIAKDAMEDIIVSSNPRPVSGTEEIIELLKLSY
ncbi:MAG: iron-containing alcohol dehydrogenase [Aestuariivita sp.]|nr:iron-containing alcohol dehydrogenase [Aestuariivita sp.]MCY4203611.1 iron-containing alcohol dehydrogenase [Aestuariivita sp.]